VILDSQLKLSPKSRILTTVDRDVLVFTAAALPSPKARKLENVGVELVPLPARHGQLDLKAVLKELGRREILSVLLEAGPTLNGSALAAKVVDKLFLFYTPKIAGRATVPFVRGNFPAPQIRALHYRERDFGGDFAMEAWLRK
jgi:diaminohydroxyphosphoribosylaminopyrimidine deaminase/5-amino-6-(5-phosphoribosylamino)uracil reductase